MLKGLTEVLPIRDEKNLITTLSANTVILCGENDVDFKSFSVFIQAYTLWVRGFGYTLNGTSASTFSIITKNFGFSGSFGVISKGLSGSTTVLGGPSIFLAAQNFLNDPVDSYIRTEGSDYIEDSKK